MSRTNPLTSHLPIQWNSSPSPVNFWISNPFTPSNLLSIAIPSLDFRQQPAWFWESLSIISHPKLSMDREDLTISVTVERRALARVGQRPALIQNWMRVPALIVSHWFRLLCVVSDTVPVVVTAGKYHSYLPVLHMLWPAEV